MSQKSLQTLKEIGILKSIAGERLLEIKNDQLRPSGLIRDFRTYSKAEAQAWLGIKHPTQFTRDLKRIESEFDKVSFEREENGHYKFTIRDLHFLADNMNVPRFERGEDDGCQIISVANLKGGVGKTTDAVHLATGLAVANNKRYRIAIVDMDPQGTASMFGIPEINDEDYTVGDLLQNNYELDEGESEKEFIRSCFKKTHIPNLDYLPGRVSDFFFESYAERSQMEKADDGFAIYRTLKEKVIDQVKDDFDIIIIDTAPSLNKAFYNAIFASTSVIIPLVPELVCFDATLKYLERFEEIYALAHKAGHPGLDFIRMLVTNFDATGNPESTSVHRTYFQDLKNLFSSRVIPHPVKNSKAIPICADNFMTIFEMKLSEYPKSRNQLKNAVLNFTDVVWEVESLCTQSWPSTAARI